MIKKIENIFIHTTHKIAIFPILVVTLFCVLSGCSNDSDEVDPALAFLKIYDDARFNASYIPLDVIQTEDEGYLILSGTRIESSDFVGVYVMKADKDGNFISDIQFPGTVVHPVGKWMYLNDTYYFFCMNASSLGVQLYGVTQNGNVLDPIDINTTYPMHASLDGNQFLLLSYSNNSKSTILSLLNSDGAMQMSKSFTIGTGEGIEEPIINHFTRTGKQYPFTCGKSGDGSYYFNGFYNYTFSLVFTDFVSDDPTGVVQGQQEKGGFSALYPLTGNIFAASRFNFGDNFTLPKTAINTTGISSGVDLGGNSSLEWIPDAHVGIERLSLATQDVVFYGSTTKNSQIMLSLYDTNDGTWKGTDYLGYLSPYFFVSMKPTVDKGLAVLGLTSVAGRFNRICLFKLSEKDLSEMIQQ